MNESIWSLYKRCNKKRVKFISLGIRLLLCEWERQLDKTIEEFEGRLETYRKD